MEVKPKPQPLQKLTEEREGKAKVEGKHKKQEPPKQKKNRIGSERNRKRKKRKEEMGKERGRKER